MQTLGFSFFFPDNMEAMSITRGHYENPGKRWFISDLDNVIEIKEIINLMKAFGGMKYFRTKKILQLL